MAQMRDTQMFTDFPRLPFSARDGKRTVNAVLLVVTLVLGLFGSVLPSNVNETLNLASSSASCRRYCTRHSKWKSV